MEFTSELSSFQGVLISVDNVYSFTKLTAKGGNEDKIKYIVESVRNFLLEEKYINDKGVVQNEMLRYFTFYLILNADLPVLEEMVDMEELANVVWTVPTIANCLLCEMLWNFSMGDFVHEIIVFSYPKLSLELTDALLYHVKYFSPQECLQPLQILSSACYKLICRLKFFNFEDKQLQSAFMNFQRCLNYLTHPPNSSRFERTPKDDLYKFLGKSVHAMLSTIHECFNQYINTQTFSPDHALNIYTYTHKEGCINNTTDYKPNQCTNVLIKDCVENCHIELLDKCKELVMSISVDVFCAWREFEEKGINMQQTIGELSYNIRKTLLGSNLCEHPLVAMLEQISCKPTDIKEDIDTIDVEVITENILKDKVNRKKWIQALTYKNKLCEDASLVNLLDLHLELLNEDECYTLFKKLHYNVDNCSENKDIVQSLTIKAYQRCGKEVKHDVLEDHFKNRLFNNTMECSQLNHMLTGIFNKLAMTPEPDLSDILGVFIQNPRKVYDKIFNFALDNTHQTQIMIKVLSFLEEFTNHVYDEDAEPCFIIALKDILETPLNSDIKQNSIITFVSTLKEINIIPGAKLLLLIIMPRLHKAVIDRDHKMMHLQIRLIHGSYSSAELIEFRAPMIVMLAQVMDRVRWKIDTYDVISPYTLSLVTNLQLLLMSSWDQIPEYEIRWLKNKLKGIDPLNMYYFRNLWNPPGNTYLEIISGVKINRDMDPQQLNIILVQVLCSSIKSEWKKIWESLHLFGKHKSIDLVHNALLSIMAAEKSNHTESTWQCVINCYKNFFQLIRRKFLKEPLHDSQVSLVTNILLETIDLISEDKIKEFGSVIMPLFAFIVERKEDYTDDMWERLQNQLKHTKLWNDIGHLFSNEGTVDTTCQDFLNVCKYDS